MIGKICHIWYEDDNKNKILLDIIVNEIDYTINYTQSYFITETDFSLNGSLKDFDKKKWEKYINEM